MGMLRRMLILAFFLCCSCQYFAAALAGDPEAEPDLSSGSDLDDGDLPLEPERAWWNVRRHWADALPDAGVPAPIAAAPRFRTQAVSDRLSVRCCCGDSDVDI